MTHSDFDLPQHVLQIFQQLDHFSLCIRVEARCLLDQGHSSEPGRVYMLYSRDQLTQLTYNLADTHVRRLDCSWKHFSLSAISLPPPPRVFAHMRR